MKRKIAFAVALSAAMVVSLSACGKSPSTEGGGGQTTPAQSASQDNTTTAGTTAAGATDATQAPSDKKGTNMMATDPSKLPAQAKNRKGTLICGSLDFQGVFNPFWMETNEDYRIASIMNASLGISTPEGKMADGTAKLTVSPDGTVYTYKISDKDKFTDGTKTTAQDYANFYKVIADPSYDGYTDFSLDRIKGWADYQKGNATDIAGVKALDDKTLQITLEAPNSIAVYDLSSVIPISTKHYGSMIKKGDLSKLKAVDMKTWVGNGAYTLADVKEKASVTLKAATNSTYYLGNPKIPTIIFKVVAANAELQALESGDVDLEEDVVSDQDHIDEATSAGFINMHLQPTLGYGYVALNHKNPMFQDQKVRQALLYALDRKSVVQAVYGKYASVINIPQANVSFVYDDSGINTYDFNLDKAKSLLAEAGWVEKDGKLMKDGKQMKFTMSATSDNPVTDAMIPTMIDNYGKLGIDFQAEYVDWPTLSSKSQNLDYDMYFMAWGLTANPDMSGIYASPDKGGGQNHYGYSNSQLDDLFAQARTATSDDQLKADYKKIYQLWNQYLPVLPIYQRSDLICYNSRIKGLDPSPYVKWYAQDHLTSLSLED